MTITTTRARRGAGRPAGFTLAEVLIASTIAAIVLAGVLSSFLMMGRSGANAYNYVDMEAQARRGLEQFGEDVRMAKAAHWTNSQDITLWMSSSNAANAATDVRYYYDTSGTASSNPTYHCFVRYGPDRITNVIGSTILIRNVQTDFKFVGWKKGSPPVVTTSDALIFQLQLALTIRIQSVTASAASNLVVSARYILRNHF